MRVVILFFLLALPRLVFSQSALNVEGDFAKLSWLEGTWTRTNAKPGRSGMERWTRGEGKELIGRGVNMKGTDTSFVEKLKIVIKSGEIYYVSDVPENRKPVDFKLTSITDNSFVCENPSHDFPKMIAYYRDGRNLRAVISGDGKQIEYLFVKQ